MVPREIRTEHWPDKTSYHFPIRPIGKWRMIGSFPIGFGILSTRSPRRQVVWQVVSAPVRLTSQVLTPRLPLNEVKRPSNTAFG